uniref:Niemann-Pick C1 N-terminal domain-containing protein n=1 Tax=Cajanus cajan TaxID=3821 RepID=A0A151T581_CAJCA|nr:hypothetical protein KK1_016720 [Cajanus cajan]
MVLKKRKNYFHFVLCRKRHSEDYCSMSGICGTRSDGKVVNCPYGSPAVKVFINALLSSKIQSLCPTITGNVCCTEAQFDTLRTQVQQVNLLSFLF